MEFTHLLQLPEMPSNSTLDVLPSKAKKGSPKQEFSTVEEEEFERVFRTDEEAFSPGSRKQKGRNR